MPRRARPALDPERLRAQTARNVAGLEHEQRGEIDRAIALYELNVAERFQGEWPYTRLASIYQRLGRPDDVVRVIEAAVEAFARPGPRPTPERRAVLRAFRQRLQELRGDTRRARPGSP